MKKFSFIQVAILAVLLATVASCGMPMGATGDYYEDAPARRGTYYGDPYYSNRNVVVVERDPYTGQYYQVVPGPYGVYGAPAYPYSNRTYNQRRYNNNNRINNNRNYNTGRSNNGYYRTNPQVQQPRQQQTPAQQEQIRRERADAKDAILGPKRN
jgi:hypothetical protein